MGRGEIHVGLDRPAVHRAGLGDVLAGYERILVPELNTGQLVRLVRAEFLVDAEGYSKVQGLPFAISELEQEIEKRI